MRRLAVITVVSAVAVIVNPYGWRILTVPFDTVGIGVLQDFIQEWASPDFHRPQVWPFAALLIGLLAAVGIGDRRLDWSDLVLCGGTALMALMAGRNIAVFALVATPVLSRHIHDWLTARGWQVRPLRQVSGAKLALNWVLLALVLVGVLAKAAVALNPNTMREAQREAFPVELAQHLQSAPPEGKLFNSYNWGGYLLFAAPDVPVTPTGAPISTVILCCATISRSRFAGRLMPYSTSRRSWRSRSKRIACWRRCSASDPSSGVSSALTMVARLCSSA